MNLRFFLAVFLGSAISAFAQRPLAANETLATGDVISLVALHPQTSGSSWAQGGARNAEVGRVLLGARDLGTDSATRWRVLETAPGIYSLQCLAFRDGPMWLNGGTRSGETALALSPNGVSGASWAFYREEGGGYRVKCLGKVPGSRWLIASGNGPRLSAEDEIPAALWQVHVWTWAERKPRK